MQTHPVHQLIEDIRRAPHSLTRVPETHSVMEETSSVNDFNEVMRTNVTINYAAALDLVHRIRAETKLKSRSAIDLCCGPGHYTMCLDSFLGYNDLTGVDLSEAMLDHARANFQQLQTSSKSEFKTGNALELESKNFRKYDLVSCTNAAHHFDSIFDVRSLLKFAEEVCHSDGLIVLTDLCRLPTAETSRCFIEMIGDDYVNNGLLSLAEDFRASMYAAWSPDEMAQAIPSFSDRAWYQVIAGGLPFFQGLIGLPAGRNELFLREGKDWLESGIHRTARAAQDWANMRPSLYEGQVRLLTPGLSTKAMPEAA